MFDKSSDNPLIPSFLRLVIAVECSVVFVAAVLLFLLPGFAEDVWAWTIPPFNARFVGAVYFAAYIPLIIFWSTARWTPGRLVLWMIFAFTALITVVMFIHWDTFAWNRPSTYLVFWPLYIFLPVNSAVFLFKSQGVQRVRTSETPAVWRIILPVFALFGGIYGLGLLIVPETFASFWPWNVDAFHARIYASAFVTPAVGAWMLSRRGAASEYLTFGLNLLAGGFLPILGTLWTNAGLPAERQIVFDSGTWAFFVLFLFTGILGIGQIRLAIQKAK
jgi:hypothetical protein